MRVFTILPQKHWSDVAQAARAELARRERDALQAGVDAVMKWTTHAPEFWQVKIRNEMNYAIEQARKKSTPTEEKSNG